MIHPPQINIPSDDGRERRYGIAGGVTRRQRGIYLLGVTQDESQSPSSEYLIFTFSGAVVGHAGGDVNISVRSGADGQWYTASTYISGTGTTTVVIRFIGFVCPIIGIRITGTPTIVTPAPGQPPIVPGQTLPPTPPPIYLVDVVRTVGSPHGDRAGLTFSAPITAGPTVVDGKLPGDVGDGGLLISVLPGHGLIGAGEIIVIYDEDGEVSTVGPYVVLQCIAGDDDTGDVDDWEISIPPALIVGAPGCGQIFWPQQMGQFTRLVETVITPEATLGLRFDQDIELGVDGLDSSMEFEFSCDPGNYHSPTGIDVFYDGDFDTPGSSPSVRCGVFIDFGAVVDLDEITVLSWRIRSNPILIVPAAGSGLIISPQASPVV